MPNTYTDVPIATGASLLESYPRTIAAVKELRAKSYWTWDEWRKILGAARAERWMPHLTEAMIQRCRAAVAHDMHAKVFWTMLYGYVPEERT
jgi:hypothetical protein